MNAGLPLIPLRRFPALTHLRTMGKIAPMDPGNHAAPVPSTAQDTSVERILTIIRRDLMLGADVELTADTPLFGGEFELDSLDALLLMQSLEREFGFKMSTSSFGPDAFRNASALKAFVDAHLP